MTREASEKAESDKVIAEALEKSEQRLIRVSIAHFCLNRAENLSPLLVTESVQAVNEVARQVDHDAVSRLQRRLVRAY